MIVISDVANLSSVGSKIVVEKDWIVVVAGGDENKLATMNSVFRTIDLTALVISPTFAGLIIDFASSEAAAATIGVWNLVSVVIEYYLLLLIYKQYPELAKDKKINE